MTDFLIKSTVCLCVLLGAYYLFLEKEKMHQFNRFYLLFSILFSFIIPFITIKVIEEITQPIETGNLQMIPMNIIVQEETNYLPLVLWSLYGIITLLLMIRFIRNILKIVKKIKANTAIEYENSKLILIKEKILPHTFLNSIFINETDYNNRNIEKELYTHELTHVKQKHTFDILFIEIIKTIFWFNPIFIFYKKAIQLNHEFLADERVVESYNNVPFYQSLLLSKANGNQTIYLASNLNYLVTKKRLIMMTKTTPASKSLLKKLALMPLFSGLIFFLCTETVAVAQEKPMKATKGTSSKTITKEEYYKDTRFIIKSKNGEKAEKRFSDLTEKQKLNVPELMPITARKSPTQKQLEDWKNGEKFAIWIDNKHINNSEINNYTPKNIALAQASFVYKNARSKKIPQEYQVSLYTEKGYQKNFSNKEKIYPKVIEWQINEDGNTKKVNQYFGQAAEKTAKKESKDNKKPNVDEVYTTVQEKPDFPGGIAEFYKYIGQNYKIPSDFKGKGKIIITFVVEKDGALSDMKLVKNLGFGTGEEAIRILKESPKWIPGKQDGQPVRVQYALPITISEKA